MSLSISRSCPLPALWTAGVPVSLGRLKHQLSPTPKSANIKSASFLVLGLVVTVSRFQQSRPWFTSVHDALIMQVFCSGSDGPDYLCCIPESPISESSIIPQPDALLEVASSRTYPVEQLSTSTQIEDKL